MIQTVPMFALGRPEFDDPVIRRIQLVQGDLAAWQTLLAAGPPAAALSQVGGSFALAIARADGSLLLAVDRFAIETLCYCVQDGNLRCAARADALAAAGAEIDPQAIFDYLYFHAIPSPRTIYKGVLRLPPGQYMVLVGGRPEVLSYWTPHFEPALAPSFPALRDQFMGLARQAVKRQLDGSRPACFLSGGTDSSTVAGLIGDVTGQAAATFSIGFDAEGYDEMAFARIAAKHFKTDHHEYYVTPDDLVNHIPGVAASHDQPFGNSSALPAYCCALKAREAGVTRLLAGDGGDELFGGNSRYAKQRIFGWYSKLPAALRSGLMEPVFGSAGIARLPLLKKGASYIEQARVPMPDRLQMYNLLLHLGLPDVLCPGFLAQIDAQGPATQQREVYGAVAADHEIDRMLAFDWRFTLAESDLPKVRNSIELAGISVGFPLLDKDLLDLSLRLPPDYKLRGLKLRWFFKEALRGYLPDAIIVKKKQGFGLPFGVWAMRHSGLQELAADSLRSLATRGIVRPAFIETLLNSHLPAHPGYYGEMVWILMMLEQWLRTHVADFKLAA